MGCGFGIEWCSGVVYGYRKFSDELRELGETCGNDGLTGLPNRLQLRERIAHSIALAARQSTRIAVFFLDLDNFKLVNGSLGHAVGDGLLASIAARLLACTRSTDTVCRHGGDEFIVVTINEQSVVSITSTANYPQDGTDAATLISNADAAMFYAKKNGRGKLQFFNRDMNRRALERQVIEGRLRHAENRDELVLHYQPKIDSAHGVICGADALLRWRQPGRRLMLPDRFVRIAEECGFTEAICHWVLRDACGKARQWQDAGLNFGVIAVNVSASEFRSLGFLNGVSSVLEETGLDPVASTIGTDGRHFDA